MHVSIEHIGDLGKKLTIVVPVEQLSTCVNERMREVAQKAQIKGYRPGKVDPKVLERHYGVSVRTEAMEKVLQKALTEALKEHELNPALPPKIEFTEQPNPEKKDLAPLSFVAHLEVYPQVILSDFASCTVETPEVTLTDDDVEKTLVTTCQNMGSLEQVDRPIESGDHVVADLRRRMDGEAEPSESEQSTLVMDEEHTLKEVCQALLGHKKGDHVEIAVTYADDWHETQWAGQSATLFAVVQEVKVKKPLTPEEVVARLKLDDVPALKKVIKEHMEQQMMRRVFEQQKEAVLAWLLREHPFPLPEQLVAREQSNMIHQEHGAHQHEEDEACDHETHLTDEEKAQFAERAQKSVRLGLMLRHIIQTQDMKADPKRVQANVLKSLSDMGMNPSPELLKMYYESKELMARVEHGVLLDQVVEYILNVAQKTPKTTTYAELIDHD